ncbi:hypothetical protein EB796_022423 [Bugula neritina]|uniref:Uncharacterized protein n=1 Tax=Bugula neritina TaxID=10212 RepID=A0A7J7J1G6_BUGNE|nr:hypothetical protein EB796_022423 [Bugula neritina]
MYFATHYQYPFLPNNQNTALATCNREPLYSQLLTPSPKIIVLKIIDKPKIFFIKNLKPNLEISKLLKVCIHMVLLAVWTRHCKVEKFMNKLKVNLI